MIEVEALTKTYRGFTAVDDISFRAEAGHYQPGMLKSRKTG